jgi:Mce-associated membrane protein
MDAASRRADRAAGEDAAQAARDSIVALFSYQAANAQQSLEAAARDRLTGKFGDDYTQLVKTVVLPEAVAKHISATAQVPAVGVVSSDTRHAILLAYVDQAVTAGSAAPTQMKSTVRVTMDKIDGRWLISGFDPI